MKLQNVRKVYEAWQAVKQIKQFGDKTKKIAAAAAVAGTAAALPVVLIKPGRPSARKKAPFQDRNFAHRGLHTKDQQVPENSLAAFRAAVEAGYGIELDVQLSRDGQVVVMHDDNLMRICGVNKRVDELTWPELRGMRLCGSEEHIPMFAEVLKTVDGKTPLIVELKTGRHNGELCEKTRALLDGYRGDACIESFNPFIVAWFRFHAPELLRGQLSMQPEAFEHEGFRKAQGFILGNTLLNSIAKPEFIAYRLGPRPLPVRLAERLGAMKVGWTAHAAAAEKGRDAVIFEFYRPRAVYKQP